MKIAINRAQILAQIRANIVAIMSMIVALTGIAYNTWRNEKTEINHSVRIAAFETLRRDGKIGSYGVSNFDADDMEELRRVPGGSAATTNQVLYNLTRRGVEWDLLPWCREHGVPIMAYSPIDQARMLGSSELKKLAEKRGVTAAQLALAWLLHQDGVIAIPKAGRVDHLRENAAALTITLSKDDLAALDHAFPPPKKRKPLEML